MACDIDILGRVPLFALLDAEERAVLAANVELRHFAQNQKIYKLGDTNGKAYVLLSGKVRVSSIDEDRQEIVVDEPAAGEFFGFASMLEQTPHQTSAIALESTEALEIDRNDISALLHTKPMAGMDMLTVLGKQFHASHNLVRMRAARNANEVIDEKETLGDRIADAVASFGGSWKFIILFAVVLVGYVILNTLEFLQIVSWDPYPFSLLNVFLSLLAALQAPIIMMSQNRADSKDRLRAELDYNVNLKAEMEVAQLLETVRRIEDRLDDLQHKAQIK
jgi:uncharacterized membrane protein